MPLPSLQDDALVARGKAQDSLGGPEVDGLEMEHHLVQQQRAVVVLLRLVDVPGDERWKSAVGSVRIRWEEATDDDAVGGDKRLRGTRD